MAGAANTMSPTGGILYAEPICYWHFKKTASSSTAGPRLNIKTIFPRYGDSHVKDKTVGETVLSLTWESLYW